MSASSKAKPHVHMVAVCYHLRPASFIERLQTLASRCGRRLRGIAIANNAGHPLDSPTPDIEVLRGTNSQLDFSGYFEGLERLAATHPDTASGNVLFLNDSLLTKHAGGHILGRVLSLDPLLQHLMVPAMAGKFDPYRSICLRNPWSGHTGYMTSFCFLLNARAQPTLRRLPADAAADGVLMASPVHDAAWGAGMHPLMREQIRAHLVYEGSPYLWPRAGVDHAELMRKKASCVYFEHRLSGAIGNDGALVPINSGPRLRAGLFLNEMAARVARTLTGARR